jgi:transcriptional regulator with XRE-family HTH domain
MNNFILNLADLGKAFRAERKALGLTQSEVAKKAGLRRETIIQIEAGENVSAYTLIQSTSALSKCIAIVDKRVNYDELEKVFNES